MWKPKQRKIQTRTFLLLVVSSTVICLFIPTEVASAYVSQETCKAYLQKTEDCSNLELCYVELGRPCSCVEVGECAFTQDPLATMLYPFDAVLNGSIVDYTQTGTTNPGIPISGLSLVIFWGLMVGILWLRTETPMLVGLVGMAMVAGSMSGTPEDSIPGEFEMARYIGAALFLASLGISIYQMVTTRLHSPIQ